MGSRPLHLGPAALLAAALACAAGCSGRKEPVIARDGGVRARAEAGLQPGVAASGGMAAASKAADPGRDDDGDEPASPPCPAGDLRDPDRVLDEAAARYDEGAFATALGCADVAADLVPQAVEPHHLRGAALAALARFPEAQNAFALALALDPDDPETLAAAADFYINVLPPKRRESTLIGLEYARRGSDKASRRRRDRALRARLSLLEGQALNDLGRADEALPRVEEALALAPELEEARHERGVSLFSLCRLDEARADFSAVLAKIPDDAFAHHHLGLILERQGKPGEAEIHFARARALAPDDFPPPVAVTPAEFQRLVDDAIAQLPPDQRALLDGVSVEVADLPDPADLTAVDPPFSPTILGLFRGLPVGVEPEPVRPGAGASAPPRAIVFYRLNLARAVRTRGELALQVGKTLLHEMGHLRGLDEDELRRRGLE